MKSAYRMFQRKTRGNYFYIQNNLTKEQRSLKTTDEKIAQQLLDAENKACGSAALNMQLGKVYIGHADPKMAARTWKEAMNELSSHGKESSRARFERELKAKRFDSIRDKAIIETTSEDLQRVLRNGGAATNNFLRRLHNLALGNGWIHWHIISPKQWPKSPKTPKRGITADEHSKILAAEQNPERKHYYEMLWHTGAAQTDCALLKAEDCDWSKRILSYRRLKTGGVCALRIGPALEALLAKLPKSGFLFPHIASLKDKDRSAEFCRRRGLLELSGISLHSYRYSWAERAYAAGYAERFAQAALGHKSSAIHHGYAKRALVICPALDEVENKVVKLAQPSAAGGSESQILTA